MSNTASTTGQAATGPFDYKDHMLIGLTADGSVLVLRRWRYVPTQTEIKARIAEAKKPYVQFAVVNVVGLVQTGE